MAAFSQQIKMKEPIAKEISELQQFEGSETQMLYRNIIQQQEILTSQIAERSWELKKLAEIRHLCGVENDILQTKIIKNQRLTWVNTCPRSMRPLVIEQTHSHHHSGINRTYNHIKLS